MANVGNHGSHPDLTNEVIDHLQGMFSPIGVTINADMLEILQQRTVFERPHPNPERSSAVDLTTLFASLEPVSSSADRTLMIYEFGREDGSSDWLMTGHTTTAMGNPPLKPFVGLTSIGPRAGISIGMFVTHEDIASMELALSDGTVVTDQVANQSMLIFAPFDSPAAWADDAEFRILDTNGGEVIRQRVRVDPGPPSGT